MKGSPPSPPPNLVPTFLFAPVPQTVSLGKTKVYSFPSVIDESPSTVAMSSTPIETWIIITRTTSPAPPSFIATISPPILSFGLVKVNKYSLVLTDDKGATKSYLL